MKDADEVFDFGFTTVSEDELEAIQNAESSVAGIQEKLENLHQAVLPLLKNLKQNPDKDYIYWPDRVAKVEAFELYLDKIMSA